VRAPDVAIAGGGLAGAAAAIRLAEAGVSVTLIERSRGPHDKVCGEFLSAEALTLLNILGVPAESLGAVPIRRMGFFASTGTAEAPLPFPAAGLSRRVLDEALLDRAAAAGACVLRGISVRDIRTNPGGSVTLRLDGGREMTAGTLLVATGKHDLRGRPRPAGPHGDLVGFKLHLTPRPEVMADLAGRVELVGLPGGYAGVQQVDGGLANLCLLLPRRAVAAKDGAAGLLPRLRRVSPRLDDLLDGATPVQTRPLAIARIPYGFVRRDAEAGVRWLGDQAAVIPSFSGDGMSIALWTGMEAAESVLRSESAAAFQARIAEAVRGQVGRATRLSRMMVRPWFQAAATAVVAAAPSLARRIARSTRLQPVFAAS
jgi:flavin-dependent dehydrogenase